MPGTGMLLLSAVRRSVAFAALIVPIAFGDASFGAGPFDWAPLAWIGRRSCAIYLWHVPMMCLAYHLLPGGPLAATAEDVALTLAVTMASWRFVEQSALRHKPRFERRPAARLAPAA
jgi:peptidoglycan/LPS O-acetylase OafA/YrhL